MVALSAPVIILDSWSDQTHGPSPIVKHEVSIEVDL